MVDTGAMVSCFSRKFFLEEIVNNYYLKEPSIKSVSGVGNQPIEVMGEVEVPIKVAEIEIVHTFLVLARTNIPVILGMDFCTKHGATIDFKRKEISFYDGLTSTPLCTGEWWKEVMVRELIVLPPQTETILTLKTRGYCKNGNVIFEPRSDFSNAWNAVPARTVSRLKRGRVVGKVLNPNNAAVTLLPGTVIGNIEYILDRDIRGKQALVTVATLEERKERTNYGNVKAELSALGIEIQESDLTDNQKDNLVEFLLKNKDIFAKDASELGLTNLGSMNIDTGNHPPVRMRPYRVSPQIKQEISRQIHDMLDHDIIRPSTSAYASPVVMVKKKSGEYRFAVDYRRLNAITTTINYPLPRFEDVIDMVGNAKYFSTMDLVSGFWQIPIAPESRHKTAFISHEGLFEFNRVPFGLKNSPVVFQHIMETALRGLHYRNVLVYIDDIIVFSKDFDSHIENLQEVFDHLRGAGLKLKPSKCHFGVKQVAYLGHILTKHGVMADPEKVRLVKEFPEPRNQKELRGFLGLANYYRKFIEGFAATAAPLTKLLTKDTNFIWDNDAQKAFDVLKTKLTTAPILAYPDFDKEFILYTDASANAIGYVLGQRDDDKRERVICFSGRGLRASEKNWSVSEKECLAVIEGIKYFRVYLANTRFIVKTDHKAIEFLKNVKEPNGRLGRWIIFLQGYNYEIQYKPGSKHGNADSLSRRPYPETPEDDEEEAGEIPKVWAIREEKGQEENLREFCKIEKGEDKIEDKCKDSKSDNSTQTDQIIDVHVEEDWRQERELFIASLETDTIQRLQREDDQLKQMIDYIEKNILPDDRKEARVIIMEAQDHLIDEGILYHLWYPRTGGTKNQRVVKQVVVPKVLRNDILLANHDSLLAGAHQGIDRTYQLIRYRYYWPHMYNDIVQYTKTCLECQASKRVIGEKRPPLSPLPVTALFQRLHIDFLGPFELSPEGFKYILLVIDAYSKWPEAFPLASTEATEVAWVLYKEIFCRYGAPDTLLSDRGQQFMSKLVNELCSIFSVTKLKTSAYHPQTNAQAERFNSFLTQSLRTVCSENTQEWPKKIPGILAAYRVTPCSQSTQFSPYFLLFKRECRLPLDVALIPPSTLPANAETCMKGIIDSFQITQNIVKDNIKKAQEKYTRYYNQNAQQHKFTVGQKVWVYNPQVKKGKSSKLQRKWYGPYYICVELSNNAFIVRRSKDNKQMTAPVNACRLKPYFDPLDRPTNVLPEVEMTENELMTESDEESLYDEQTQEKTAENAQPEDTKHEKVEEELDDEISTGGDTEMEENLYEVDKIVACRSRNGQREYKVKWKGYKGFTWEPLDNIPEPLLQDFHIKRTYKGNTRRRPRQFKKQTKQTQNTNR